MREVVIVDSVRTGLAKSFRGKFNQTRPDDMAALAVRKPLRSTAAKSAWSKPASCFSVGPNPSLALDRHRGAACNLLPHCHTLALVSPCCTHT